MKHTFVLIIAMSLFLPFSLRGETIDEYISKNHNKPGTVRLWGNGLWVSIQKYDPSNIDGMLQELYTKISYDEGKPKKWSILESKIADFGYGEYLIVRVKAFGKEHMHFFSSTRTKMDKEFVFFAR